MRQLSHASPFGCAALLSALCFSSGCGGGGDSESTGTLSLGTTVEIEGTTYRLEGATFRVEGPETVVLSTPDPPTPLPLQAELTPGSYDVTLESGWTLQRGIGTAYETVSGATLTTMNPQQINIVQRQVARLGFAFDAAGVAVDLTQTGGEGDQDYD